MKDRFLSKARGEFTGGWVQGYFNYKFTKGDLAPVISKNLGDDSVSSTAIDPKTLSQCTGLKDKNGTLIFEGDIVDLVIDESAWGQYGKTKHVECCIAYDNGAFMYNRTNKNHSVRGCYPVQKYSGFVSVRVIGNIHDKEETQ